MSTVALVPLRGGSKGIPKKNIKLLLGKPLCYWVLKAAVDSKVFDRVLVSTDSGEIKTVVDSLKLPVGVMMRPSYLATDGATTESVMLHTIEHNLDIDTLVTIQATSPLLNKWHLNYSLDLYKYMHYDSLVSTTVFKRFLWTWDGEPINYDPEDRPRRQCNEGVMMENGAFYISNVELLKQTKCRLHGKIGTYMMPSDTAIELDEPGDWPIVEQLLRGRQLEQG